MMKIGFLLNIVLLLCFICSQALIWLLDGTLVTALVQLLDHQSTVFRKSSAINQSSTAPTRQASKAALSNSSTSSTTSARRTSASGGYQSSQNNIFQNGVHHHHQRTRNSGGKPTAYERASNQHLTQLKKEKAEVKTDKNSNMTASKDVPSQEVQVDEPLAFVP